MTRKSDKSKKSAKKKAARRAPSGYQLTEKGEAALAAAKQAAAIEQPAEQTEA